MSDVTDALDRLLADACPPATVRAIEHGAAPTALWRALEDSGFLDALVPEAHGGAGLTLETGFDLFVLQGRHAVPVPMTQAMARRGLGLPDSDDLPRTLAAVLTAAHIVGALERVLATTVAFANQREQFGRPIGKFQAVQHQLAVMAEQVAAARIAAQIGCAGGGEHLVPDALRAAVAKSRTSEAAAIVAPMAHAIHGAIGITADLDLQLYTRRLHAWRMEHGSEHAWHRVLGQAALASPDALALDFLRSSVLPHQGPPDA